MGANPTGEVVSVGTQQLSLGSAQLGWMHESKLSEGRVVLQQRLDTDGYLLLRELISPVRVQRGLAKIVTTLAEAGYFAPGTDPMDRQIAAKAQERRPYDGYELLHSKEVLNVLESDELHDFFSMLWGETAGTFDNKWFRAVGPGGFSGFHMDKVYMGRGSDRLHTVWIPWADTPVELGGLVVLEGSASLPGFERMRATYGEHDVDSTPIKNSGWISTDSVELLQYDTSARWVTAKEFKMGDVVILSMKCLHGSIHNHSASTLRLSCDVRFQPAADDFDTRWVPSEPGTRPGGHNAAALESQPDKTMTLEEAKEAWGLIVPRSIAAL